MGTLKRNSFLATLFAVATMTKSGCTIPTSNKIHDFSRAPDLDKVKLRYGSKIHNKDNVAAHKFDFVRRSFAHSYGLFRNRTTGEYTEKRISRHSGVDHVDAVHLTRKADRYFGLSF
jgi:hypothetical protein